jgi:polysaccharide pyruvyl transferase WcaK-like protein
MSLKIIFSITFAKYLKNHFIIKFAVIYNYMKKIFKNLTRLPFDFNFKKWRFLINVLESNSQELKIVGNWFFVKCSEQVSRNILLKYKKIIVTGAKSDLDILKFCTINTSLTNSFVFVVQLDINNQDQFGTEILDDQNIIYMLEDSVVDLQDCFHRYNLIHKSYSLSKSWFWINYYSLCINHLTANGEFIHYSDVNKVSIISHQINFFLELIYRKYDLRLKLMKLNSNINNLFSSKNKKPTPISELKHILITGWYGTETIGDKAILMEVIYSLKENNPNVKFSITSIIPGLSYLTNKELGLDIQIHDLSKLNFFKLKDIDGVVFGGGPLMDSSQLKFIQVLFKWANRLGKKTIIFGCGVGPIKTQNNDYLISSILKNTSSAFFRDEKSALFAKKLGFKGKLMWACDPALRYVIRWNNSKKDIFLSKKITCLFREQTNEYSKNSVNITSQNIQIFNDFLSRISSEFDAISLLPMHTFWYGKDDREYIKAINNYKNIPSLEHSKSILSLDQLLNSLKSSSYGIPMRYHGHIFMAGLGIPFISIDYTGNGGKISSFMKRYNLQKMSVSVDDLNNHEVLLSKFKVLKKNENEILSDIRKQVSKDINLLLECYKYLGIHI